MVENEIQLTKKQQKERIRERYKGVDPDILEVIPARKKADFYDDEPRRVAVYVRVSTDDPRQTSSYELQRNYYEDMVERHETWTLVSIYADEGISGTSLQHRDAFNRMIADCKAGKIDMIITKSVSRFARNIVDCISIVRELGALTPPVGVFFETEHIFTLKDDSEMGLSFQATMAQEESHVKSNIMNASIEMRFSHGIVLTPVLLGYDHDEDGNLIVNEDEAKTVRLIFFMYLYGYTCQQIAETLTALERPTKRGNTMWAPATILGHLRNERYCGDVLTRKTYTPSYLNHKSKKNTGDRTQHRWRNHHEAIISMDDFIAVQHLIDNAKYGNKGLLPELQVIPEGALKGFVCINPRWGGFRDIDYELASESAYGDCEYSPPELKDVEAQSGEFDFRGFEIARSQFFNTTDRLCVTISIKDVVFSTPCVRKFDNATYVELLIHPQEHLLAVRKSTKDNRHAVRWSRMSSEGIYVSKGIPGAAFLPAIFSLLDWKAECKYRIQGIRRQNGKDSVLIFDLRETEVFVPEETLLEKTLNSSGESGDIAEMGSVILGSGNRVVAFPSAWADNFGSNYYRHAQARELAILSGQGDWQISETAKPYTNLDLNTTPQNQLAMGIQDIIKEIREEKDTDGYCGTSDESDS